MSQKGVRYFEYRQGQSNKFWEITLDGREYTVRFGKIGSAGQKKTKSFSTAGEAKAEANKLMIKKNRKGYVYLPDGIGADEDTMSTEDPIVTLVRDLSQEDPEMMALVSSFLDSPPTGIEQIGFYGCEGISAKARIYYGVVSALDRAGHIYSVEDKYSDELVQRWIGEGLIEVDALPAVGKKMVSSMANTEFMDLEEEELEKLRDELFRDYGQATRELEEYLEKKGKALLSIDVNEGDTLFFAVVEEAIAKRWRDTAFVEVDGYRAGVRSAMWDRFWFNFNYAMLWGSDLEVEEEDPPGTRLRDNDIPLVSERAIP